MIYVYETHPITIPIWVWVMFGIYAAAMVGIAIIAIWHYYKLRTDPGYRRWWESVPCDVTGRADGDYCLIHRRPHRVCEELRQTHRVGENGGPPHSVGENDRPPHSVGENRRRPITSVGQALLEEVKNE